MTRGIGRLLREYPAAFRTFRLALSISSLRRVVLAFGAASAIEAATWLAIGVYAYERSGATSVGVVGLILLLPSAAAAPFAAALADEHRRQRILAASYILLAIAVTATCIALWMDAPQAVVYVLATLTSVVFTPVRSAQGALLPSISTAPADLTSANIALTTMRNIGLLAGPLSAGILLQIGGPAAVFTASALVAVVAVWLLIRVPADTPRSPSGATRVRHVVEGVRLLLREERAALVVGLAFLKHIVMGAVRVFLVIIALGLLGMGSSGAGILSTALGIGGFLGAGTAMLYVGRRRLTPGLVQGAVLLGLPIAAIGIVPHVLLAFVAMACVGVGRSLIDVSGRTLLGRLSPDVALARFLGVLEGMSYGGLAAGSAVAALLVHMIGIRMALVITGAFLPALVLVVLEPLTGIDRGPLVSRDRLDLILRVPMFAPLPPESIERLASQLEPVMAEEGAILIRQGDVGDRFYVLETGKAEVIVDGKVVAELLPCDGFGEIALLHDVPRTATVRITCPSRVMALDRVHFLAVVSEEPVSMVEAERLVANRLLDLSARQRAEGSRRRKVDEGGEP